MDLILKTKEERVVRLASRDTYVPMFTVVYFYSSFYFKGFLDYFLTNGFLLGKSTSFQRKHGRGKHRYVSVPVMEMVF